MSEKKEKVKLDVSSAEFEEKHDKQAHGVYVGVIIFLIVAFVAGFTYGIFAVTAIEGQMDMSESVLTDFVVPETKQQAYDYIITAIEKAVSEKPKLRTDHAFQIDDGTLQTNLGPDVLDTYKFVKNGINDIIKQDFEFVETNFFDDMSEYLRVPKLTEGEIADFSVKYSTYKCRMCGNASDDQLDSCDLCGCDYPYKLTYNDDVEIVLNVNDNQQTIDNNYDTRTVSRVEDLLKGSYENFMNIDSLDFNYDNLSVKAIINKTSGQIKYLEYSVNADVKSNVTFINDFSSLSSTNFDFKGLELTAYSFEWPAINLSSGYMQIGFKDNSSNIVARLVCDDPVAYTVNWKSSDPSVCDVDKDGYLKSHKKTGKATITASFEFGGKTFSSDCVVEVLEGVSDMKLKKRSVKLDVGETYQLEANVKPSNATVKTVKWYTFDESIATVDENGVVTAVSPGTVKVFAITDNGSYRSSCEVTVK
ncbi:MAG: Ig domain-containing protein [Clostridia bacterium]|nr:Ig domain-containing protein [Clostridia bacterium]